MRLSIVTPSYNQGLYIEETLRSVISQREYIHEYFVLDGGSDDESVEIIERYAPWIDHWTSQKDQGQADAIKRGFEMATGDILYWLNSDDLLLPGALKRAQEVFTRLPLTDVLTGYAAAVDENTCILDMNRRPHDSPNWNRFGYLRVHQPTCFIRAETYREAGGLDPQYQCVLDTELWYRLMAATANWAHADAFMAAYRIHPEMKGQRLTELYKKEREMLRHRYPNARVNPVYYNFGRIGFYASQIWSGRMQQNSKNRTHERGKPLTSVFGNWDPLPAVE